MFFEYEKINHYKLSDNVRQAIKRRQATIDEDALEAKTWVDKHAGDVKYRYSEQQWQNPIDPSNIIYDIGDDAIKASTMGIKNLKYVLSSLFRDTIFASHIFT